MSLQQPRIHFRLLSRYVRIAHNDFFYRRVVCQGWEQVPPPGVPIVVVGNHQNALGDPLALECIFTDRRLTIFATAKAFASKPLSYFLRGLNLLPAFRMRTDGEESVGRNNAVFQEAGERLMRGEALAIFPEATNQTRRWLGPFTQGYLKMAFEAARTANFQKEVFILPVGLHYGSYFDFRTDSMANFGTPISLQPYYELYQTKPRTAMRQANDEVRAALRPLMLDIQDEAHNDTLEYLRATYARDWMQRHGLDASRLEQQLLVDQRLVQVLQTASDDTIYDEADALRAQADALRLQPTDPEGAWTVGRLCGHALWLLLLLPLFVLGCIPNIVAVYAHRPICKKLRAIGGPFTLFQSGVMFALNVLITLPVSWLLLFFLEHYALQLGWRWCLLHLILQPMLGLLAWDWYIQARTWVRSVRVHVLERQGKLNAWKQRRNALWAKLDSLF